MARSSLPSSLQSRLLATALTLGVAGAGVGVAVVHNTSSPAVRLAMELGSYYEGTRFTPYQDSAGIWTVCRGITFDVVQGKTYTQEECLALELNHYRELERRAQALYHYWPTYNLYVKASLLDMLFNLGEPQVSQSTHLKLANSGNLAAACAQMTRWVWARDARTGQKVPLEGLVNRRTSTAELCSQWGRTGHFSAPTQLAQSQQAGEV